MSGALTRLLVVLVGCAAAAPCRGDTAAAELLARSSLLGGASALVTRVSLRIVLPNGEKSRELELYAQRTGFGYRVRAQVVAPAFLREMTFLWLRDADGTRSSWLKTSQGVRRLGSGGADERLFDSDLTVEDLTEIDAERFDLRMAGSRSVEGVECDVVEARARRQPAGSQARKLVLVERSSLLTRAVEYYDGAGVLRKRYTVFATQRFGEATLPKEARMEDLAAGTRTELRFESVRSGEAIPDRLFSVAGL